MRDTSTSTRTGDCIADWSNVEWHEPMKMERKSHGPYDIYVIADVEGLKAENVELKERVEELQMENARLHAHLDRFRRKGITKEEDWEWLTT